MRYSDNRIIKTGDLVCLRGRQLGVIGCVIDNDDYTDEFPKSDYAYLERGIMLRLSNGNVLYLEEYTEELVLISRGVDEKNPAFPWSDDVDGRE